MSNSAFRKIRRKINNLKKKADDLLRIYEYYDDTLSYDRIESSGIEHDERWKAICKDLAAYGMQLEIKRFYDFPTRNQICKPSKGRAIIVMTKIGCKTKEKNIIEIAPDKISVENKF